MSSWAEHYVEDDQTLPSEVEIGMKSSSTVTGVLCQNSCSSQGHMQRPAHLLQAVGIAAAFLVTYLVLLERLSFAASWMETGCFVEKGYVAPFG